MHSDPRSPSRSAPSAMDGPASREAVGPGAGRRRPGPATPPMGLARGPGGGSGWTRMLGVASVALGTPAVVAAGLVCRLAGLEETPGARIAVRAVGARELAVAAGLLARPRRWLLWARVAGDAVDLALLGRALAGRAARDRTRPAGVTAAIAGITLTDLYAAATSGRVSGEVEVQAAVTVNRPRSEVFEYFRRLENLAAFMAHLDEVRATGDRRSHWVATAPFGRTVEWDAELVEEVHAERIRWTTTETAAVTHEGTVRFVDAPGGRGTEVHVDLRVAVPGGDLGLALARYFGEEPRQQLDDDLRRLKQVLETGVVVRSDGAPGGERARREFPQHPARPLTPEELREELDGPRPHAAGGGTSDPTEGRR